MNLDINLELVAACIVMLVSILTILVVNDRMKRKKAEKAWSEGRKPDRKFMNHRTDWILVTLMMFGASAIAVVAGNGMTVETSLPASTRGLFHLAGAVFKICLSVGIWIFVILFVVAGILALIQSLWIYRERRKNRHFVRVEQLALEGDVTAAIELVHEFLRRDSEDVATTENHTAVNYLSALEGMRGNWHEAFILIERLEVACRFKHPNKGLTLWKLGKRSAAEICLREFVQSAPNNPIATCMFGLFLADSGRHGEATQILHSIDQKLAELRGVPQKTAVEIALESLRREVSRSTSEICSDNGPTETGTDEALGTVLISNATQITFFNSKRTKPQAPATNPSSAGSIPAPANQSRAERRE